MSHYDIEIRTTGTGKKEAQKIVRILKISDSGEMDIREKTEVRAATLAMLLRVYVDRLKQAAKKRKKHKTK